jgi:hypothetical protein
VPPFASRGRPGAVHGDLSFAHFHRDRELDLRLTRAVIKKLALVHPAGSLRHPRRSPNSDWIELRCAQPGDIARVVDLVECAVAAFRTRT